MLASAGTASADTTSLGRLRAAIELDGVCENAMGVALDALRIEPKWQFPQKLDQQSDALEHWEVPGRMAVLALHTARNQAHHHGVVPDADEVAGWVAEVERFVRSLVVAVHGRRLEDTHVADAVDDEELRELIAQAELHLEEGDAGSSFDASWDALEAARRRWQSQRARHGRTITPSPLTRTQDRLGKELREGIAALDEFVEISVFATDFGEYVWLTTQRRESFNRSGPEQEDARRALVFVLTWILRWETFNARFPEERWEAWWDQDAPTTGLRHLQPVVIDVRSVAATTMHGYAGVMFQLADIPPNDDEIYRHRWDTHFYSAFEDVQEEGLEGLPEEVRAFIAPRGELTVEFPSDVEVEPETLLEFVDRLINRTQERYEALIAAGKAKEARERELAEPYLELVGSLEQPAIEIQSVRAQEAAHERRDGPTEDQIIVDVRLPDGVASIDLENIIRSETKVELHGFGSEIWFPRDSFSPQEVRERLRMAGEQAVREQERDQQIQTSRQHQAGRLVDELRGELRRRNISGPPEEGEP
jgi:hypothetical protein